MPPRIERLCLRLQRYDLHLTYVPGKENYTADTLSRLPNQAKVYSITEADVQVHVEGIMATTLVSDRKKTEIKHEMEQDTSMQKLIKVIQAGWPDGQMNVKLAHVNSKHIGIIEMNSVFMKDSSTKVNA